MEIDRKRVAALRRLIASGDLGTLGKLQHKPSIRPSRTFPISTTLSKAERERLDAYCEAAGISRAELLRQALAHTYPGLLDPE